MRKARKKTYIKLKYRGNNFKLKLGILSALALLLVSMLAIVVFGQLATPQTFTKQEASDTYTKYFFTRHECRYIFPEGSCVVEDKYCDKNSYDYQVISLEPYDKYCLPGTVVYNKPSENNKPRIVERPKNGKCEFEVAEGETVRLHPEGYDPDPEIGPAGRLIWTFYPPFDSKGVWKTRKGDAGITESKIKLSDGELYDLATFCVEVYSTNSAPQLAVLKDVNAKEGETVKVTPVCRDPDGDKVTTKITGFMTSTTRRLGYDDQGKHKVTVTCTDPQGASDTEDFYVNVADVNRPPTLDVPEEIRIKEGETAHIAAKASDPDGDKVRITYETPFDAAGNWKTKKGDAGTYTIRVTASDGSKKTTKSVRVIVEKVNSAPVLQSIRDITVHEGETITLHPKATDADGDRITYRYSGWMTGPTKTTGYDDAGEYDVTITASDGVDQDVTHVHITVLNTNRPPVITKI